MIMGDCREPFMNYQWSIVREIVVLFSSIAHFAKRLNVMDAVAAILGDRENMISMQSLTRLMTFAAMIIDKSQHFTPLFSAKMARSTLSFCFVFVIPCPMFCAEFGIVVIGVSKPLPIPFLYLWATIIFKHILSSMQFEPFLILDAIFASIFAFALLAPTGDTSFIDSIGGIVSAKLIKRFIDSAMRTVLHVGFPLPLCMIGVVGSQQRMAFRRVITPS